MCSVCAVTGAAVAAHRCDEQHATASPLGLFSTADMEHAGLIVKQLIKEEEGMKARAIFISLLIVCVCVYVSVWRVCVSLCVCMLANVCASFVYPEEQETPNAKHLDTKLPAPCSS